MQYKGLEIHHVGHLVSCETGVSWLRIPEPVHQSLESDMGKWMAKTAIGVELRFVIKSGTAKITMKSLSSPAVMTTFHVFHGGIQSGWEGHEMNKFIPTTPTVYEFTRPGNMETLQKMTNEAGFDWDPEVFRLVLERGEICIVDVEGDIAPPTRHQTPQNTLLTYGSSITHGSNSLSISNAWPSVVAHRWNMDLINLGFAGSCYMEPAMIDYIASEGEKGHWQQAILELGINVLHWDEALIKERVTYTLQQIANRNPDKHIFVISPFYSADDFYERGEAKKWRHCMSVLYHQLKLPNIRMINGLHLLGEMKYISADEVHPTIYGMQRIAEGIISWVDSVNYPDTWIDDDADY